MTAEERSVFVKDVDDRNWNIWINQPFTQEQLGKLNREHERLIKEAEWLVLNTDNENNYKNKLIQAATVKNIITYVTTNKWHTTTST